MKVFRILTPFLALLILNMTLSSNLILKTTQNDKKMSKYVCKVTKDIISSKSDTQDVLIGNLAGELWSSTANDIAGCVGSDNAVVFSDFKSFVIKKTLRKAAVIILAELITSIVANHKDSTLWNHNAKIIFLINNLIDAATLSQIVNTLKLFGIQNFVLVYEHKNEVFVLVLDYIKRKVTRHLSTKSFYQDIFYNKLNDLHGYPYRIVACAQLPRVIIENMTIHSALLYFLQAVAKIQNGNLWIRVLNNCKDVIVYWKQRLMDISLNTAVEVYFPSIPKLLTYEEIGYCALVPLPQTNSLFQSIFIEPFDGLTWLFFALTMICSVAVFWMFRGRGAVDSPWLLVYGMFVMFIGQGVHFSRKNRFVLTILLQLIILMIWVLSTAYESIITSFMIQPMYEQRLETFDDLIASEHDIITDETFIDSLNETLALEKLKSRSIETIFEEWGTLKKTMQKSEKIVILECDQIEMMMTLQLPNGNKVSEHYYMLPKKLSSYLVRLEASYFNPFIERLQYYMDLSFQAGLMHIWNVFVSPSKIKKNLFHSSSEPSLLKLEDLTQVFSILIFGYVLSIVVLLFEIFFHDILKKLELTCLARKLRNRVHQMAYKKQKQPKHPKYQKGALYYIIHRRKRVKRLRARKLKVRRIYVQPRFPMD
ncbi:unnamed protein product [Chironomus riparius]|uniref:Ionotropic receptor n=1 Tax=Chironomus riparius TaxID=315576 RepID=A0A9N9S565_9DIPT|nr:unnamed protein product [Chironomus riparius]